VFCNYLLLFFLPTSGGICTNTKIFKRPNSLVDFRPASIHKNALAAFHSLLPVFPLALQHAVSLITTLLGPT
ncbi:hypothetical protein QCA50_020836, partial [Cerrena zonata]